MSDLGSYHVQQDAHRRSVDLGRSTRYSEAVNRYLGATGYREAERAAPAPRRPGRPSTGVVLVGVDETPTSYTAVDHAAIEAELRGWDLRMVHVQHSGGRHPARPEAGERLLERLTDRVHAYSPSVAVTGRIVLGATAPTLLSAAADADLVVVGHRHSAAGMTFGLSVGDRIAARHGGAVLVVRVPGWPPGPEFGKRPVVAGIDGTMQAPAARFALEEARLRGCDLVAVHVGAGLTPAEGPETVGGVLVRHRVVGDDPVAALVEASNRAAAVVVGRHGPGTVPTGQLGPVSRALVQHAYCPVFLTG